MTFHVGGPLSSQGHEVFSQWVDAIVISIEKQCLAYHIKGQRLPMIESLAKKIHDLNFLRVIDRGPVHEETLPYLAEPKFIFEQKLEHVDQVIGAFEV